MKTVVYNCDKCGMDMPEATMRLIQITVQRGESRDWAYTQILGHLCDQCLQTSHAPIHTPLTPPEQFIKALDEYVQALLESRT